MYMCVCVCVCARVYIYLYQNKNIHSVKTQVNRLKDTQRKILKTYTG